MKIMILALSAATMLCSSGCIYSNFRVPVSKDFQNTHTAEKTGTASCRSIAWIAAWGDAGLQAAALEGGLETLEYVDYQFINVIFGLYMSRTTIVYGK